MLSPFRTGRTTALVLALTSGVAFSAFLPGDPTRETSPAPVATLWPCVDSAHAAEAGFYAQPPMREEELARFIDGFPAFKAWSRKTGDRPAPSIDATGTPGFTWSDGAAAKARELGWQPERFFFVLGKAAACLAVIENDEDYSAKARPPDLPAVSKEEVALVQRHLVSLLRATSE